jgi:U4/U6 small nuclear ribonucleoprotein PRP31
MSLADSFLADLEDIEGLEMETVSAPMAPVPENDTITILDDPKLQSYICSIESSVSVDGSDLSFLSEANQYIPLLDAEIHAIYKMVCEVFSRRFPELEQIVIMPIDYIRVVKRLVAMNSFSKLSVEDISDLVPANQAVAITVTASTSRGLSHLPEADTRLIEARIGLGIRLDDKKTIIVNFLTQKMPIYAPNLCILLGSLIASQLVAAAGGLANLATMPAQNIEAVGSHKQSLSGLGGSNAKSSLLSKCDLVENSPIDARKRAMRLVTGKASICARVDRFGSDKTGATGLRLRQEIIEAIDKASELPPARAVKPLAVPEIDKPNKSRRGGRRARAWKEKYGLTELQKRAGRLQFGHVEGDLDIDGTVIGSKRVEMEGGRIRAIQPKTKKSSSNS